MEVWNKESWSGSVIEDMYLGSCKLTYDQLTVGTDIKERHSLLKDHQVVGSILIHRAFQGDEDQDYLDLVVQTKYDVHKGFDLIQEPSINHNLNAVSSSKALFDTKSIFADPLADWKASILAQ